MKPRALVADDDAVLRYTLRGVLEHAGLEVDEAPDGAAALEKFAADRHELVISDLRMPRMDGLELLRRIRELRADATFLMITGEGSERHAVEAMKLGAYDYLKKPFDNDELTAVVRRATESVRMNGEIERLSGELNLSRSLVFQSQAMSRLALMIRVAPAITNWVASGSGMPLSMSLKMDCAPKEMPRPTTPAEASRGFRSMLKSGRICNKARKPMAP